MKIVLLLLVLIASSSAYQSKFKALDEEFNLDYSENLVQPPRPVDLLPFTEEEAEEFFKFVFTLMDADNSGLIDFFEFSIAYTYQYEETFGQRALETEIATHFKAICGQYFDQINYENFKEWFLNVVLVIFNPLPEKPQYLEYQEQQDGEVPPELQPSFIQMSAKCSECMKSKDSSACAECTSHHKAFPINKQKFLEKAKSLKLKLKAQQDGEYQQEETTSNDWTWTIPEDDPNYQCAHNYSQYSIEGLEYFYYWFCQGFDYYDTNGSGQLDIVEYSKVFYENYYWQYELTPPIPTVVLSFMSVGTWDKTQIDKYEYIDYLQQEIYLWFNTPYDYFETGYPAFEQWMINSFDSQNAEFHQKYPEFAQMIENGQWDPYLVEKFTEFVYKYLDTNCNGSLDINEFFAGYEYFSVFIYHKFATINDALNAFNVLKVYTWNDLSSYNFQEWFKLVFQLVIYPPKVEQYTEEFSLFQKQLNKKN